MAYTRIQQFTPRTYTARYTPVTYRAPAVSLRQSLRLPSAMQLNRYNMSGAGYVGPRISQNNSVARQFYSNVNATSIRSGTNKFGPWIPSMKPGAMDSFRAWHSTASKALDRDMRAMQAMQASQPPQIIYKYNPVNRGNAVNSLVNNQNFNREGWRSYSGQGGRTSARNDMNRFSINNTSAGAINRMR